MLGITDCRSVSTPKLHPADLSTGYSDSQISYHWYCRGGSNYSKIYIGWTYQNPSNWSNGDASGSSGQFYVTHSADDEYSVTYDGTNVKRWYNGTEIYSVARALGSVGSVYPFFVNSTIYDQNAIPTDVEFGPLEMEGETTGNRLATTQGQVPVMGPQFVCIPGSHSIDVYANTHVPFDNDGKYITLHEKDLDERLSVQENDEKSPSVKAVLNSVPLPEIEKTPTPIF